LTRQSAYDAGTVKIFSGLPGHLVLRQTYGMGHNFRDNIAFADVDYFDPIGFLRAQLVFDLSGSVFTTYTYPIITSDNDQRENLTLDGVIEPFPIRPRVAFFSMDAPFESHDVKGGVMGGNLDRRLGGDSVQTVYEFQTRGSIVPYLDAVDSFHGIPLPGYFIDEQSKIVAFNDNQGGVVGDINLQPDFSDPITSPYLLMSGAHDNYIPSYKVSACAGFVYDGVAGVGTDSLAFGGMVH
jgi:hypothetical protein